MPFKHITIREQGLQAYLDSPHQLRRHKGKGYTAFEAMLVNGASKAHIRREMNVTSPNTINTWIQIYREEHAS